MALNPAPILDSVVSHAMTLGLFERVNQHEPKNAPGNGLTCAVWVQYLGPVRGGSGLAVTSGRLELQVRLFSHMMQEPQDAIDPALLDACAQLMGAYSGDFDLGGSVRAVDLLGQAGAPLEARAGYIEQDRKLFRVLDITVPILVNDVWGQSA
jgi:hypothetical protein